MLDIIVPKNIELFDDETQTFIPVTGSNEEVMHLEHSLFSMAKWEAKWKIPFIDNRNQKTDEQMIDYYRCMCLNPECFNDLVFLNLGYDNYEKIQKYIEDPMTATFFSEQPKEASNKPFTNEVLYGQMVGLQIPFECQYWHLNRLITLIRVVSDNNREPSKDKKMTNEALAERARLNAMRRAKYNSKG